MCSEVDETQGIKLIVDPLFFMLIVDEELARIIATEYSQYEELVAHLYEDKSSYTEDSQLLVDKP